MLSYPTLDSQLLFTGEIDPAVAGIRADGKQHILEIFNRQIADGLHPGSQLVVLRHGQVVVDRAAGTADTNTGMPVDPNTPFLTYSVSKALTAVCVHRLIEEGRVSWDEPITRYWPEWGC